MSEPRNAPLPEIPDVSSATDSQNASLIQEAERWNTTRLGLEAQLALVKNQLEQLRPQSTGDAGTKETGESPAGTSSPSGTAPEVPSTVPASPSAEPALSTPDPELAALLAEASGLLEGVNTAKLKAALAVHTLDAEAAYDLLKARGAIVNGKLSDAGSLDSLLPASMIKAKGHSGAGSTGPLEAFNVDSDLELVRKANEDFSFFERNAEKVRAARRRLSTRR